ncbi:MAG: hypothetical protein IJL92_07040, partial [Thermoguttaceae bacterium]|nr:hypothetical protein [Thermoguttaceae bacterium]
MTNASFWNTPPITPRGPVHSDGTVIWSKFDPLGSGKQGKTFIGVTKRGGAAIKKAAIVGETVAAASPDRGRYGVRRGGATRRRARAPNRAI